FYTPTGWQGQYSSLGVIETKDIRRLLVDSNVIQGGDFAFLIKSSAQGGACGQNCGTHDVTIRNNIVRDTRNGANNARITSAGGVPMTNVLYDNNVFRNIGASSQGWTGGAGKAMQVLGAPANFQIRNWTVEGMANTWLNFSNAPNSPLSGFSFTNVVARGPTQYRSHISPGQFAQYYSSNVTLGMVYGDCAPSQLPITCQGSVPAGAGADIGRINQMTSGVVR
ncbi:MAG: hypothetical protein ACR2QM_04540, partial [Longimicrobiales bacterium]